MNPEIGFAYQKDRKNIVEEKYYTEVIKSIEIRNYLDYYLKKLIIIDDLT